MAKKRTETKLDTIVETVKAELLAKSPTHDYHMKDLFAEVSKRIKPLLRSGEFDVSDMLAMHAVTHNDKAHRKSEDIHSHSGFCPHEDGITAMGDGRRIPDYYMTPDNWDRYEVNVIDKNLERQIKGTARWKAGKRAALTDWRTNYRECKFTGEFIRKRDGKKRERTPREPLLDQHPEE